MMHTKPDTNWISRLLDRNVHLVPRSSPADIPGARAFWDLSHLNRDLPDVAEVHEKVVMRSRHDESLTAEIYVPCGAGPFTTVLYLHGGGWCFWSPAHVRKLAMRIAAQGFVVANLDYGLAPEHRFPWAVEDVVFAARWMAKNAERYRGKRENLILAGDSAGANLAAAAIVALIGETDTMVDGDSLAGVQVSLAGALLLYGIYDFPLAFAEPGANVTSGVIETTWNLAYLGPNFVRLHRNPLVSPAYAPNIANFPPCYLSCGARDDLLSQSLNMSRTLIRAGVPTTLSVVAEADHAFLMMAESMASARKEFRHICDWLADITRPEACNDPATTRDDRQERL
jgi:acetyl esterase